MSDPSQYVVGWICALMTEYVAAQEFLDEEHEGPAFVSSNDTNGYTLGKMGQHNVVIAALPDGEYGTASAANVATNMLNSFPNIRIGLMVGIGGGVPSKKHDIRLGDVVVSASRDNEGGVFQYDFGKAIQGQGFEHTRFLDQPPTTLRTAMTGIRAQYERKGHRLEKAIQDILEKNPRLCQKYRRPDPSTDRLFQAEVIHAYEDCARCAGGPSNLVLRSKRAIHEDDPAIHYGLIASGNELMKDALIRDRLAAGKDVLCFEMEAAGLMNTFPCLVVRGICDYADSHKSKGWQGYAAMVAAAYAKDLLRQIPLSRIEAEKRIGDIVSDLKNIVHDHREIALKQLELQQNSVNMRLTGKQEKCLQLFRLATGATDVTYEWYKDRAGDRVEGTCEWFVNHENFQRWLKQDSGPLLVSADPGCGKSVLARHLIDDVLPRTSHATICYFFFKDQDQNTARQALCALLHQLFSQKPFLIEHAMGSFKLNGPKLIESTIQLWNILEKAIKDSQAGPMIIILDALDECAESEFADLMRNVKRCSLQSDGGKIRFLLTSRPYEQIIEGLRYLQNFPYIHIPGEGSSEKISQEISHVIQYRVEQLAKGKELEDPVKSHLAKRLLKATHRTYLWVHLVFDYLKATAFKKTVKGVDSVTVTLPANVNEAYEQILNKSKEPRVARRVLSIILAARRPMTISEMNIALNVNDTLTCIHELDLEGNEEFRAAVKLQLEKGAGTESKDGGGRTPLSWAAENGHEMIVNLLLNKGATSDSEDKGGRTPLSWAAGNGHEMVAKLLLDKGTRPDSKDIDGRTPLSWAAGNGRQMVFKLLLEKGADFDSEDSSGRSPLLWAARNGHEMIAKLLLEKSAAFDLCDVDNMTPLLYASGNWSEELVLLLLGSGCDVNSRLRRRCWTRRMENLHVTYQVDERFESSIQEQKSVGLTALHFTALNGIVGMTTLLLGHGADPNALDENGDTPLHLAIRRRVQGHKYADPWVTGENAVEVSSDYISDCEGEEASDIWAAIDQARENTVQQLLNSQAIDANISNSVGEFPLHVIPFETGRASHACAVLLLLLEYGVSASSLNSERQTCLHLASKAGNQDAVGILLEKGCDITLLDKHGLSPIHYAVRQYCPDVLQHMFEKRPGQLSQFCVQNNRLEKTLLHYHAESDMCSTEMFNILLKVGCDIDRLDPEGNSVLSQYLRSFHLRLDYDVFKFLCERSSMESIHWKDQEQRNLLHVLMRQWSDENVLILEHLMEVVDITAKDADGMGIEHHGAIHGAFNKPLTQFLRDGGHLNLYSKDFNHKTPLQYAEEEASRERHPDLFQGHRWQSSLRNLRAEDENA